MNREAWLTALAAQIESYFKGFRLSPYRLTCGWPSAGGVGLRRRVVGECHSDKSSKAGLHEIFISPLLDKPLEVAGTVVHEMAHVAAGVEAGHGRAFIKVARHVGLTRGRPMTVMPGAALEERLAKVVEGLGDYPHQRIELTLRQKRVSTVIRLMCNRCGCPVTISLKWLIASGGPVCGCGGLMEVAEKNA